MTQNIPIAKLKPNPSNPRIIKDEKFRKLVQSIKEFPEMLQLRPIVVDADLIVLGGNMRLKACQAAGLQEVPVVIASDLTPEKQREFVIKDNVGFGEWEWEALANEWDAKNLEDWAVDLPEYQKEDGINSGALSEAFLVPPFSVLNAREGLWQERKRLWLDLGIKSEIGRDIEPTMIAKDAPAYMAGRGNNKGGSIFDPVLCEVLYTWFCPQNGTILDPFAGGSVRGIVASRCNRQYVGVDLRSEQIAANKSQLHLSGTNKPIWYCADSRTIDVLCKNVQADFLFSCPPYADLEIYSNNIADISNMPYKEFLAAYREIIAKSCMLLNQNSFACFVVGEVRDSSGAYYDFIGDTVQAFCDAGLTFYNEIIFVTPVGSLPVRTGRQFLASRKIGKTHQNVLVFLKGDAKATTRRCGDIQLFDFSTMQDD